MTQPRLIITDRETPIRQALRYLDRLAATVEAVDFVPGAFGGLGVRIDGGRITEFVQEGGIEHG